MNSDEKNNEQNSNETAIRIKTKENNNDKEIKNTLNKDEINFSIDLNEKNFETEEWFTILKKVKITKEMVIKLAKTRIGESIEQLVRIIMEKNMQIRVIYNENNKWRNRKFKKRKRKFHAKRFNRRKFYI